MRKIWILIFCVALVAVGVYFAKKYLFYDISIGSINPAIKLPGKDVRQYLPQNNQVSYPFMLKPGYKIDAFADLGSNLPRALAWDSENNLVVSSTKQGKVLVLPDVDSNGKADRIVELISGLNKPHGIAFDDDMIYIAETDNVSRYPYNSGDFTVGAPQLLFELPAGGRHFTRTIRIHNGKLYTSIGSSCDVCIEKDWRRASILVSNLDGSDLKVYAKGLRNTVFFIFDKDGKMWGTDMGRDDLGDDLPPDELNQINEGKDYGWPYCYGDRVRDNKFKSGESMSYCMSTESPVYSFQAHVAPLGLAFVKSNQFTNSDQGDLIVAFHGSTNRSSPVGYSLTQLDVFANYVSSQENIVYGWQRNTDVFGRPVDVSFSKDGSLYVSDDFASLIYIIEKD